METVGVLLTLSMTVSASVGQEESLQLEAGRCWGYEADCPWGSHVGNISCLPGSRGWAGDEDPRRTFHRQADFGFLKEKLGSLVTLCRPTGPDIGSQSELRCSKNLEFCTATNLVLDFRSVEPRLKTENLKYRMDIFSAGDLQLSGCQLDQRALTSQLELMSPLQSWAPELQHISRVEGEERRCDVTLEEPTVIAKLDAGVNMYHHFCDFFNLYLSLHLNYSLSDMKAEVWDKRKQVLVLENIPSTTKSPFSPAWAAFTSLPLLDLNDVGGKVVCIKRALFPLLARSV